jgi:hypothetical protein
MTACGGGASSPLAPSVVATPDPGLPSGTAFDVVNPSGDPVAGARVTVGTQTYTTDASGQFSLREGAPYGSLLDVIAPGFLDRQTMVRRDDSRRFVLWPRTTKYVDESYTVELVYTAGAQSPGSTGANPLQRVRRGTTEAVVVPSREILDDDRAMASHMDAVAALNAALAGRLTYSVSPTRPSSGLVFEAKIDPTDPICVDRTLGYAQNSLRSGEIASGTIVYCHPEEISFMLVAHELGHTVGLQHSPNVGDIMYRFIGRAGDRFSAPETLIMGLLFERPGGNRYPDNDRAVAAAARETVTIVD